MQRTAGLALAFLAVPAAIAAAVVILFVAGYSYQTASGEAGTSGRPGTTVAPVAFLLLLSAILLTLDRKGPRDAKT